MLTETAIKKKFFFIMILCLFILSCKQEDVPPVSSTNSSKSVCKEDINLVNVPSFNLKNLEGKEFSLNNFKGKIVLLNFWATWCVPCVAEMPALERLYKTYKDKNFEIVAVSVDAQESESDVKKFAEDKGLSFTILRDSEMNFATNFGVSGFPETYFVDSNGKLLDFEDPAADCIGKQVKGDRAWDSASYISAVGKLLK